MDQHLPMKRALAALGLGGAGVALLAAITASCGGDVTPSGSAEVGADVIDAAVPDRDARREADTAMFDGAGPDADVPLPGEWRPVLGLPSNCPVRVAVTPELSVPAFRWTKCSSGRDGCEVFVPDWTGPDSFAFVQSHLGGVYEENGDVVLSYTRTTRGKPAWFAIEQALHGSARRAIYGVDDSPVACIPAHVTSSPSGTTALISFVFPGGFRQFALSPDNPSTAFAQELTRALEPRLIVQGIRRGDGMVTLEHNAGGIANYVSSVRLSDGQVIPGFPGYTKPALRPIPVPGGYFVTADESLYFVPSSGEMARLVVSPGPGHRILSVDFDQRGGYAMAWLELDNTAEVATAYTSPFATTAGALQRRAVAKLPTPYPFVFNAGMLLARGAGHTSFRLVRVADGMGWDIAAEPDHASILPLWVNDDFVWQWVSGNQPGDPGFPTKNVLLKLPRAPLGAPTVSPGL